MFNHALAYVMAVLAGPNREEKGASMVEYVVLVVVIAGIVVAAMEIFGGTISDFIEGITISTT